MAINYTLNIGSVKKRLTEGEFSNVIIEASFGVSASSDPVTEVTGVDEEGNDIVETRVPSFSYSCGGTKTFSVENLDATSFVDFDSVTKDTIVQWLLAEEGVNSVEEFSYVKSSIDNIARRIYEYSLEVPDSVEGENPAGASDYVYTPPAPVEEPASEEVVDTTPISEEPAA
jgi:hypothetical protein